MEPLEYEYARETGKLLGTIRHLNKEDSDEVLIQILSTEGVKTSEIEGERLDRDSVQSSLRRKLGLASINRQVEPAEAGMAEMMMALYCDYKKPLTHKEMHQWHENIMQGRTDLEKKGDYRAHEDPMFIVSGGIGMEKIHFEAPPSKIVKKEMAKFIQWFNKSLKALKPLARASIAHLYFVCIHPYEDGNGRIARALGEKALSQSIGSPTLSGLSRQIASGKKDYYDALENNNQDLEITDWLTYFGQTIIRASNYTLQSVEQTILKTKLYQAFDNQLNDRQKKVIHKLFEAQPKGLKGGLSAKNYITITKASRATTTRDLQELVELGILRRWGERRFMRYGLNFDGNLGIHE